ncbi:hypothetical protein V1512DRAFT_238644 [Lipomyces arxii]|uniref:uncharacterized protein n=1 Tax=Lipomyces arxii TaxID=56418 RepID=UPI0034CF0B59
MSLNVASKSKMPFFAIPGQPICSAREYAPGPGTYFDEQAMSGGGAIVASLLGKVVVSRNGSNSDDNSAPTGVKRKEQSPERSLVGDMRPIISVIRASTATDSSNAVPDVDNIVLAKVTRINPRNANVAILATKEIDSSTEEFGGIIRVQDVRETEKDKVIMQNCFKPGDLVRAMVISLGDGTNYYLSTARNDLGVVFAISEAGSPMVPLDWRSMQCPVTGAIEERKCAKPK